MTMHLVDGQCTGLQSPTMTSPTDTKTVRVALDTHTQLHDLAAQLNGTADDAVRHLLGLSTIRVPVSDIQRKRWTDSARAAGVSVDEFVKMRVEAAMEFGTDPSTIRQIWSTVNALAGAAGIRPPK